MAYIREEEIIKIRQEADIVDIISDYLPLQQKGKNYVALCPFHDDHSPSLVVSKERQIFNCFTCRTGGNVFAFIMKFENVSFLEAIETVAKKIGYNLKLDKTNYDKPLKKEIMMYDLATKYFINNLNSDAGKKAREYLQNRGVNEDIIKEFKIGYALPLQDNLTKLLEKKKYELDEIVNYGLANKSGATVFDTFKNRIMIPITNKDGEVVAFTGRIFNGEDEAKYVNTKETPIFKKSNILFNYANAKPWIKKEGSVIIVEGHMDAIMLSSYGIKNVVALMGVALSEEQINNLKKLRVLVILMLDNDTAGSDATIDLGQKLLENQVEVKVVRLNKVKDPDEYVREFGKDALKENIDAAISYIDYKLNYLKLNKDLQTTSDMVKYVKEVLSSLNKADEITKDMVLGNLSEQYHIDKEILKNNLKESKSPMVEKEILKPKSFKTKYEIATNYVLYAMMNDRKYIRIYKERLGYLKNKIERIIVSQIVYYSNSYNDINIADFTTFIQDNSEIYNKVIAIINEVENTEISMEEFNKCLDVIQIEMKKDEIKELKKRLKDEMDVNIKMEILTKIAEIKKEV